MSKRDLQRVSGFRTGKWRLLQGWICFVLALSLIVVPSMLYAQNPDAENLSGDSFFDFAFRDTDNIVFSGQAGGHPETLLAQANSESQDEQEPELAAQERDTSATIQTAASILGVDLTSEGDELPGEDAEALDSKPETFQANQGDDPGANQALMRAQAMGGSNPDESFTVADLTLSCSLPFCEKPENVEALLRATGLHLGRPCRRIDLGIAVERLRKTGYFSNIHPDYRFEGKRVYVHFNTVGHTVVRKVRFDTRGSLYESDLKRRMSLRQGLPIYPRTALLRGRDVDNMAKEELMAMAIADQQKALTRLYVKEGYLDAEVEIQVTEVKPYLADLKVIVTKEGGYTLGKVYIRGHKLKTYRELESAFRSEFGFFDNATQETIKDAAEALVTLYRDEGYFQTQINFVSRKVSDNRTLDVFLDLTESPQWVVQYEGNLALGKKELSAALTFTKSGFVDSGELKASSEALRRSYISAGYYWAQVEGEIIRMSNDKPSVILFKINEGPRTEIGQIAFDGAGALTRSELLSAISSREYAAFGSGAYPQRSMIADDAAKIVDTYRERGYLNADVPRWVLEPEAKDGRLKLTFIVYEGEKSEFSNRRIRYTDRAAFETYDVFVDKPKNNTFSNDALRVERATITKQLRAKGYATITDKVFCTSYYSDGSLASEGSCEIAELPAACLPDDPATLCTQVETELGIVERCNRYYEREQGEADGNICKLGQGITGQDIDVDYEITLGPKYAFGDFFIHGNVVTRNWVVNQDLTITTGATFDYNRIMDSRSLLRRRSIYTSASLNVIGVDDALTSSLSDADSTSLNEHPVPLVINLEEGRRRWFDFALGISLTGGDWLLTGEMEYVEANLLGLGWDLRFLIMPEARFVNANNEFVFATKFNQNFFTLLTLSIPVMPSHGLTLLGQAFYDLRYIPETNKEEVGSVLELQWNASKAWFAALAFEVKSSLTSSFSLDVSDDLSQYHACYPFTFFQKCPFREDLRTLTFAVAPRAIYEGRDNPLVPRFGFYAEGKLKFAYSDAVGFYFKPELRASYVTSFWEYFTIAFNMRWGFSFLKQSKRLPLIDRYFLGGLNMRGFGNEALGPRLVNPKTPNIATNEAGGGETLFNFSTELRFPIWQKIGIYGALFVDMGALLNRQVTAYAPKAFVKALFVEQMRYTLGLGLRWLFSESIPPIVIDYGFILNRRRGDPVGGFSLNVGYTF